MKETAASEPFLSVNHSQPVARRRGLLQAPWLPRVQVPQTHWAACGYAGRAADACVQKRKGEGGRRGEFCLAVPRAWLCGHGGLFSGLSPLPSYTSGLASEGCTKAQQHLQKPPESGECPWEWWSFTPKGDTWRRGGIPALVPWHFGSFNGA